MNRKTTTDFAAVNVRGLVLRTFEDLGRAKAWAKANENIHPGVIVEEITTTVQRRQVYRPTPRTVFGDNVVKMGAR